MSIFIVASSWGSATLQPMSIFIVASSWGSATPPTNAHLYSGLILGLCHSSNQWASLWWPHLGALPLLQPMSIFTASSWGSATPPTDKYFYAGLILRLCHSSNHPDP